MKVSVHMITYNHSEFIREAIESVLMQNRDFDLELVIGDDVSKDDTREIINEYYEKYPDIIKLNFQKENVGAGENFRSTLSKCTGEYIAILEGDDYWIDKDKLKKQVEFLDNNPEYSMCFTKAVALKNNKIESSKFNYKIKDYYDTKDLIYDNFIQHLTCMFRKKEVNEYPKWLWDYKILDYPMHLLRSVDGKIGIIDEVTSVYRIHENGISNTPNKVWWYETLISILCRFDKDTDGKYSREIKNRIKIIELYLAMAESDKSKSLSLFKSSFFYNINNLESNKLKVKLILEFIRGLYGKYN